MEDYQLDVNAQHANVAFVIGHYVFFILIGKYTFCVNNSSC